jgi:hypothetical protein
VDAKRSAAGGVVDEPRQVALVGTARVATRTIETIASTVIWPSRIACLCSRLLNIPGRRGNRRAFAVDSTSQRRRDANNLAVADRSKSSVVEGIGMGLDDEDWPSKMPRLPLPERQRTAFAIMIEGLSGDRAIDVYNAGGPADLLVAHGNHAPERRHAAGQETRVREKIFERCGWPDDHQVAAGRSEIFDPVEAKLSAARGAW